MPPELVIANAPRKIYPGGVVAVRATDWLGPARGSLSTETDALASTGECVRDAQQLTPVVNGELDFSEYEDAEDTLVMPAADLGLRDNVEYEMWVTYKLDGDWDDTNVALLNGCTQRRLGHVCSIGVHGTSSLPESAAHFETDLLGHAEPYAIRRFSPGDIALTDTIYLRAFAHVGVTAEVLIDQVVFIPTFGSPLVAYQDVEGTFAGGLATALVDGADGGDDAGKFTFKDQDTFDYFMPNFNSSDYQRYADPDDAEWNLQVTPSDTLFPLAVGGDPVPASGYSLHAVRCEPFFTDDDFDNRSTTVDTRNMGISDDGYGYAIGHTEAALNPVAYVSGGVGVMKIRQSGTNISVEWGSNEQSATANQGARFDTDDAWIWSGVVEWTTGALSVGRWVFIFRSGDIAYQLRLNPVAETWQLGKLVGSTWTAVGSSHDISSWFGVGVEVGFRFEVKRYILRIRIWDATGAEPSTWDEEFFKDVMLSGTHYAYPYSDVLVRAQVAYKSFISGVWNAFAIESNSLTGNTLPYEVDLHLMTWERDMYGDPEPMTAYVEQPEGTVVGDQIVPYGCPYFVYWGTRVWTEPGGGTERLSFSTKLLNDPAAADLQRAEGTLWFFLVMPGGIVSMNWRRAQRKSTSHRVLTGG